MYESCPIFFSDTSLCEIVQTNKIDVYKFTLVNSAYTAIFHLQSKMSLSKLAGTERFESVTDSDFALFHQNVQKKNTKKNDKSAERQLCEYLSTQNASLCFWEMDYEDLDGYLSKFWFAARQIKLDPKTQKPKKYMV